MSSCVVCSSREAKVREVLGSRPDWEIWQAPLAGRGREGKGKEGEEKRGRCGAKGDTQFLCMMVRLWQDSVSQSFHS